MRPITDMLRRRFLFTTLVVLLAGLVVAAGFCLLDSHVADGHHHSVAVDLCMGMVGVPLVVTPFISLPLIGAAVASAYRGLPGTSLSVPELPPEA